MPNATATNSPVAPFLSLVIPAYNESKRIERSLHDLQNFFKSYEMAIEFIIVIEKSTDLTLELARQIVGSDPRFKIIANEVHRGKGYAVREGMLKARGKIIFFMDLDLSTPLVEVFNFMSHFETHPSTDIIIGSRQHEKSLILRKQHPLRQKMGQSFNLLVQFLAIQGIEDTQCGFKAFRKNAVFPLFSRQKLDGFSFDVEILLLGRELGFKTDILPVKWTNSPDSKVRIVRDSVKMFFDLIKIKSIVRRSLKENPP